MSDARKAEAGSAEFARESRKAADAPVWRRLLGFWIVTRVWLWFWGIMCSLAYPRSPLEQRVAAWPPSAPWGDWLARLLLAPWDRWDVEHFLKIAERGYLPGEGTLSFQPLYPYLGKLAAAMLGGNELLGLFVVSNLCSWLFLLCFVRLAALDLPGDQAYRAAIYFTALPVSFILFAPYAESLFLLLSALSLLMARRGRWWLAGLCGGLAALTRQQGLFLALPLAWEFWEWSERRVKTLLGNWRQALGLALVPIGYLTWVIFRAAVLKDVVVDLGTSHSFIYGLLLSPNSRELVADQTFVLPWKALWLALTTRHSANTVDLLAGGIYLLLFAIGGRALWRLRPSYFLYTAFVFLISFSLSTGVPQSYMGLPRHCLLAFPIVMPLAVWGRRLPAHLLITGLGLIFLMMLSLFYFCKIIWLP